MDYVLNNDDRFINETLIFLFNKLKCKKTYFYLKPVKQTYIQVEVICILLIPVPK